LRHLHGAHQTGLWIAVQAFAVVQLVCGRPQRSAAEWQHALAVAFSAHLCVCVCVCVCERERERESVCVCVCIRTCICTCIYDENENETGFVTTHYAACCYKKDLFFFSVFRHTNSSTQFLYVLSLSLSLSLSHTHTQHTHTYHAASSSTQFALFAHHQVVLFRVHHASVLRLLCLYVCVCVCVCPHASVLYIYMYIYIYVYRRMVDTHTHTHTHTQQGRVNTCPPHGTQLGGCPPACSSFCVS
jgi:hypothetical protein